jgi:protein O-GlcNAc transferase
VALARDPARLAALRQQLAANRSNHALFDTDAFCRNLEAFYFAAWRAAELGTAHDALHPPRPA